MSRPQKEKVYLKTLNTELALNFFTMADDQWIIDTFGEQRAQEGLEKYDPEVVLSIFWRQLCDDAKRRIASAKIVEWDGLVEKELSFDQPWQKLKHIVSGADELMSIWVAIISTKRKSQPEAMENLKKKVTEVAHSQSQRSSTSSGQSTDTQETTT